MTEQAKNILAELIADAKDDRYSSEAIGIRFRSVAKYLEAEQPEQPPKPLDDAQTGSLNEQAELADAQGRGAITFSMDNESSIKMLEEALKEMSHLEKPDISEYYEAVLYQAAKTYHKAITEDQWEDGFDEGRHDALEFPELEDLDQKEQETPESSRTGNVDGWKLVPVEPTDGMIDIGYDVKCMDCNSRVGWSVAEDVYTVMLSAAPQPPQASVDVEAIINSAIEAYEADENIPTVEETLDENGDIRWTVKHLAATGRLK